MTTEPPTRPGRAELLTYLNHAHHCGTCQTLLWRCPTGNSLWATYEQARGPLAHRRPA